MVQISEKVSVNGLLSLQTERSLDSVGFGENLVVTRERIKYFLLDAGKVS